MAAVVVVRFGVLDMISKNRDIHFALNLSLINWRPLLKIWILQVMSELGLNA